MQSITVLPRYCGQDNSGNGGYVAGLLASHIEGPARVRLMNPPPLETPLAISGGDGIWEMRDGEHSVAAASAVHALQAPPEPPGLFEAEAARLDYTTLEQHPCPQCFVCGPEREPGDGLQVFVGPVEGRDLYACNWQPRRDLLDVMGFIEPEFVWAVMECPGFFALGETNGELRLLGEMSGVIVQDVPGDRELIVYAWNRGSEGRKYFAGTAIADDSGRVYAQSEQTWIKLAAN